MTQPNPSATGDAEQERIKRGARVSLETRRRFTGIVVQANQQRVVVTFPGTEDLASLLAEAGAGEAHLVFRIAHQTDADPPVLVFLNRPDATANTSTEQGFVGAVAFFEHPGGHGRGTFRLPLTPALVQESGKSTVVASFVPAPFPDRESTPLTLDVHADLQLVRSVVERVG